MVSNGAGKAISWQPQGMLAPLRPDPTNSLDDGGDRGRDEAVTKL